MRIKILITVFFMCIVTVHAQQSSRINVNIGGGYSNIMGDKGEVWNPGFYLDGNIFYSINPSISLGGYLSYHKWTPDEEELTEPYSGLGIDWDVSGRAIFIEIVPSARFFLAASKNLKFFIQAGIGWAIMDLEAKMKGTWLWMYVEDTVDEEDNRASLPFGLGISFGERSKVNLEFLMLYHIIFIEDGRTEYFSAGLNIGF